MFLALFELHFVSVTVIRFEKTGVTMHLFEYRESSMRFQSFKRVYSSHFSFYKLFSVISIVAVPCLLKDFLETVTTAEPLVSRSQVA